MTPREIIARNIEFGRPDRIGMNFDGGRMNDILGASIPGEYKRTWVKGEVEYLEDLWGNIWHRMVGGSSSGQIEEPAIGDWSQLAGYKVPDLADPALYAEVRKAFSEEGDRYRVSVLPGFPFAISRYLRRMEVYLLDLLLERESIDRLHARVTSLLLDMIDRYADSGADGVMFYEDWGTQKQLLVSPALWREIFKPLYGRLCDRAHGRGLHVLMHSCGYLWEIIDDLAEVGIDVLQFDQPALYGLDQLSEKLRRLRVCLMAPVDIQRVLPTGNRQVIEAEAARMVELFGGEGGLIAMNYGDLPGIGVQPCWDQWAYDTFLSYALRR